MSSQEMESQSLVLTKRNRDSISESIYVSQFEIYSSRQTKPELEEFFQLLSKDEQDRAKQISIDSIRVFFIVSRGLLRKTLAEELNLNPKSLVFQYNSHGKPQLLREGDRIHFNVTHSHELFVIVWSLEALVGVDVEYIRPSTQFSQIAERYFSLQENALLKALPESEKHTQFFEIWTRKEAQVKALGVGISGIRKYSAELLDSSRWKFYSIPNLPSEYRGAIASQVIS